MLLVSVVQLKVIEVLLRYQRRLKPGYYMTITKTWLENIHVNVSWFKNDDFTTERYSWEWTCDIICKGIKSAADLRKKLDDVWKEMPAVCKMDDVDMGGDE